MKKEKVQSNLDLWRAEQKKNNWKGSFPKINLFFRLPIIRHVRFIHLSLRLRRHMRDWAQIGCGLIPQDRDIWFLDGVWLGQH